MIATCARDALESEGLFQFKSNPKPESCCVKHCRHGAGNRKKKVGEFWFCDRCWQARWRFRHPKHSAYRQLMDHAKVRGLAFTLSYQYFLGLMDAAGAWNPKAESYGEIVTLDRIDATLGYVQGNVRVISMSSNVAKGNRERMLPAYVQALIARKRARVAAKVGDLDGNDQVIEEDQCPF